MFNKDILWLKKAVPLAFLILLFFSLMSRMDFIVNGTLYGYGLRFSYSWAQEYWTTYYMIFIVFALAISYAYWIRAQQTQDATRFSIALCMTIVLLATGGLQDIMFFVLWGGGLPPNNVVWWWAPWISLVGTWNSTLQIGLTASTIVASIVIWRLSKKVTRLQCSLNNIVRVRWRKVAHAE